MQLAPLGVWTWLDGMTHREAADFTRRLEAWGYGALWIPETVGRDPFTLLGYLAGQTEQIVLATGIANIYARDPMAFKAIHKTLSELATDRFILGIGVSHSHLVAGVRNHEYGKPLTAMRDFLDAMEASLYIGPKAEVDAPIVLAALRDKMLGLAAERTRGAHPYLVPVEHTARARKVLGEGPWLCPELMVILEDDAEKARAAARAHMKIYMNLPNYQNNLRQFGFGDDDFRDGGSDRIVDAIIGWGDEAAIRARIQAHRDAGADHVCIQPLRIDGKPGPDMRALEALAPNA